MAQRRQSQQQEPLLNPFSQLVLFCIIALIAIGNGIRVVLGFFIAAPNHFIHALTTIIRESIHGAINWMREKRTSKITQRATRPKRIIQQNTLFFSGFNNRVAAFVSSIQKNISTFRRPIIRIPSIRVPPIHLPIITLPKFHAVALHFPRRMPSKKQEPIRKPLQLAQSTQFHPALSHIRSFTIGVFLTLIFVFLPYNAWLFLKSLPNPQLLTQRDLEVSTKIMDRNGQLLYEIYVDQNRTPVKLENIPLVVKQATIAIEDNDFYYHPGFSIRGIFRALSEIIVHKQIQGGSTITQQLIKSALLTPEVSIIRKTKEIILAFWAERLFSKDQIFEMYLNQVPYGGTAWGIESAAQTYFRKSVTQLNLSEAALLAGLPAAPSEYSPFGSHPEKAFVRQKEVLLRMRLDGYITEEQEKQALTIPIQFAQNRIGIRAPHFVMYIKDLLEKTYGSRLLERGGLRVVTSLDLGIQGKVEEIVKTHIEGLANLQVGNGAAVVTDPRSGDILAMVGSRDYFDTNRDGNVNVTTAPQQPGSSIKVVAYAAALESGMTAATIIHDAPIVFPNVGSTPYAPVNYDGKFHGPVPLRYALGNSYNIPAVKTLQTIGLPAMLDKANKMGIDSWTNDPSRYGLSLVLGGGDVTMLEMAKVYGTLANMGRRQDLRPILQITDYTGKVLEDHKPSKSVEAIKPEVAWIMSNILSDNTARTQAFGPSSSLVIPGHTVSVKTGTTNDKRDNWTIGYTPSYAAVVWVGNNDNSPMNPFLTSGITGAAPIWHDIMVEILKGRPDEIIPKPETILSLPCYFGKVEYFMIGTEPTGGRCAAIPTITPTPTP